jgi:pimeloyl-ACP methyl ester carboxylesterase
MGSERLPLGTPQWLIAGALDRILPREHGASYVERARAAGDEAWFLPVPDQGHFEVIAPGTPAWDVVEGEVLPILGRQAPGDSPMRSSRSSGSSSK